MFDTGGGGLSANAVGSKNTEAGVYKSEAFMPAGVNKSDTSLLLEVPDNGSSKSRNIFMSGIFKTIA